MLYELIKKKNHDPMYVCQIEMQSKRLNLLRIFFYYFLKVVLGLSHRVCSHVTHPYRIYNQHELSAKTLYRSEMVGVTFEHTVAH